MKPIEFASYVVVTLITCYTVLRTGEAFEPLSSPPSSDSSQTVLNSSSTDDDTDRKITTVTAD